MVTIAFSAESSDTVDSIKVKLYEKEGIRPIHHRFIFAGRHLEGSRTLAYYNIDHESTLHVVLRLCGC